MRLPTHKTKIVATIGPASRKPATLERMIRAGLHVARLNFSHGEFAMHAETIRMIREAAAAAGTRVAIMADLPGPKIRIGEIPEGPVELQAGATFVLTSKETDGDANRVWVNFEPLPRVVKNGDRLYLNDGLVQLIVQRVEGTEVICHVAVGGKLSSRKGLNLPGIDLGIRAFTKRDHECLQFALEHGVDAVSQSFVERAEDMQMVREAEK
jgi:pyruvate kinase